MMRYYVHMMSIETRRVTVSIHPRRSQMQRCVHSAIQSDQLSAHPAEKSRERLVTFT